MGQVPDSLVRAGRFDSQIRSKWCETNSEKFIAHELERFYQLSKRIICQNRTFLDAMVKELEEKKLLTFRDIARIRETSVEL